MFEKLFCMLCQLLSDSLSFIENEMSHFCIKIIMMHQSVLQILCRFDRRRKAIAGKHSDIQEAAFA